MIARISRIISSLIRILAGSAATTLRQRRAHVEPDPGPVLQPAPEHGDSSRKETVRVQTAQGVQEIELPSPSVWPAVVGLGTALAFFGIVTSPSFIAAGLLILIWGLGGWIAEIRNG